MKLLRPHDRILLVTAESASELGRMFARPQEFYESPSARFRGRYFTLDAFKSYYSKRWGNGRFSYYRDFQGYNMPGEVFLDWQKTFASNESDDEQKLLRLLGPLPDRFYLIGALAKDASTIDHEISHAFFHLFEWYRAIARRKLTLYDLRPLRHALKKIMYSDAVLDDECVSYVLFESAWMRRAGVALNALRPLHEDLLAFYRESVALYLRPRSEW